VKVVSPSALASLPKFWNKRKKVGTLEWHPRRKMFALSLHFSVMTAKSEITRQKKIDEMIRTVLSSVSFVRVAESIQRIVKQSSL
jgi:hypothetical protein